jgi:hypothetical protein
MRMIVPSLHAIIDAPRAGTRMSTPTVASYGRISQCLFTAKTPGSYAATDIYFISKPHAAAQLLRLACTDVAAQFFADK